MEIVVRHVDLADKARRGLLGRRVDCPPPTPQADRLEPATLEAVPGSLCPHTRRVMLDGVEAGRMVIVDDRYRFYPTLHTPGRWPRRICTLEPTQDESLHALNALIEERPRPTVCPVPDCGGTLHYTYPDDPGCVPYCPDCERREWNATPHGVCPHTHCQTTLQYDSWTDSTFCPECARADEWNGIGESGS